jgi:hypothetical protein
MRRLPWFNVRPERTETIHEIGDEIKGRGLFPDRKGGIPLSKQV